MQTGIIRKAPLFLFFVIHAVFWKCMNFNFFTVFFNNVLFISLKRVSSEFSFYKLC